MKAEQLFDGFFVAYAQGATTSRRSRPASEELAELHGFTPSPSLARFVDFLATNERRDRYGAFGWFGARGGHTIDWLPGDGNALAHALAQPYRLPGLLAGALPIGCDHGGNTWLVSLADERGKNEVFLVNSDTEEAHAVADSLETFVFLMGIVERDDGVTDAEKEALTGRVHTAFIERDISLEGLPASTFVMLSRVPARLAEDDIVRVALEGDAPRLARATGRGSSTGEVVAALLRLFLLCEDEALASMFVANEAHPARFVRDSITLLSRALRADNEGTAAARRRLLAPCRAAD